MSFIQLRHDPKLGLPKTKDLLEIPENIIKYAGNSCLVSFRWSKEYKPDKIISEVHACKRFINSFDGDVVFYGIEVDSPIAPTILWDVAHTLSIGNTITMIGGGGGEHYYEKEYYNSCFTIQQKDKSRIVFKKIKQLPAEESKGLDDWSFGIPTGPGDATLLNAVVKRILEFNIPKKEIILCGRPGDNFKYWDKVSIVGENIPAPPILISKKKNAIVRAAKYNNICILHDRVFLPSDFYEAMKKYGDYYSLTTLQSLYFDDKNNLTPRRYSDYDCLLNGAPVGGAQGVVLNDEFGLEVSSFSTDLFSVLERMNGYAKANVINYSINNYPTGSLYIVKKSVWNLCSLDEKLKWEEYEDVELGIRASRKGIVSRVNPYTFSQSILSRPIVLGLDGGMNHYQQSNLNLKHWKPFTDIFSLKRKPLFRSNEDTVNNKIIMFKEKYCFSSTNNTMVPHKLNLATRHNLIMKLIYESEFELSSDNIENYIKDCNNLLYLDTIPYSMQKHIYYSFINDQFNAKEQLAMSSIIINQLSLRNKKFIFMKKLSDYFCKNNLAIKLGTYISAMYLSKNNKNITYHPGGIKGYYNAIIRSTPFENYIKEEEE